MADNQSKDMVLDGSNTTAVGLMDDVVFKYFTQIKTICLWASKRGYTVHPSYKEWEIIKREYPIISLTLDELQSIERLSGMPSHLEIAKDYLSVCCRTGQRISDVKRISTLSIATGTWQIFQKKGSRQKQKVVELPLKGFCSPVIDIVNKYGGKLPTLSEQKINEHIKTVCKLAGIDQEIYIERWAGNKKIRIPGPKYSFISCHVGKKTFITILANAGIPIKSISDLTGTSIRTIEKHYLGKTEMHVMESYLTKVQENVTTLKKVI
jgi:integrase